MVCREVATNQLTFVLETVYKYLTDVRRWQRAFRFLFALFMLFESILFPSSERNFCFFKIKLTIIEIQYAEVFLEETS